MSVIAKWSGNAIADGTAMATTVGGTGDTKFDVVTISGGSSTVKNGGTYSPRIEMIPAGAAANNFFYWQTSLGGGTFPQHAFRAYIEVASFPTTNGAGIISIRDTSNVFVWWLDISNAGLLRLRNNAGTAIATSAQPVPLNTVLRIEVSYTAATDIATAYLYRGDSQIPFETLSGTGFSNTVGAQVRIGTPNNAHLLPHIYFDEIAFANTMDLIGPVTPGLVAPLSVWDGTKETAVVPYGVWDGTSLQSYTAMPYIL